MVELFSIRFKIDVELNFCYLGGPDSFSATHSTLALKRIFETEGKKVKEKNLLVNFCWSRYEGECLGYVSQNVGIIFDAMYQAGLILDRESVKEVRHTGAEGKTPRLLGRYVTIKLFKLPDDAGT